MASGGVGGITTSTTTLKVPYGLLASRHINKPERWYLISRIDDQYHAIACFAALANLSSLGKETVKLLEVREKWGAKYVLTAYGLTAFPEELKQYVSDNTNSSVVCNIYFDPDMRPLTPEYSTAYTTGAVVIEMECKDFSASLSTQPLSSFSSSSSVSSKVMDRQARLLKRRVDESKKKEKEKKKNTKDKRWFITKIMDSVMGVDYSTKVNVVNGGMSMSVDD